MNRTADVVIVGAGIVGAACARELASAGLSVIVVESGIPGGGATAAGMGHVVVMDAPEAELRLTRFSQKLWRALVPELPLTAEYRDFGTIWVAADDEETVEVRRKQQALSASGVPAEALDAQQLAEAEPNLREGLAGGLLVPEDAVLYPPAATRFFLDEAQRNGASLMRGSAVVALDDEGARLADGTIVSGAAMVNATGAHAALLTPEAQVFPRKGHLAITDRYPGFVRHQLIELGYIRSAHGTAADSVAFNVQPRPTGQALIGSSRKAHTVDPAVERSVLSRMLARACEYMPGIADLSTLRVWTGFRAATPDGLPLIGRCPGRGQVYLATGHEGLGITTCLGTAALITAQITGQEAPIPAEPYLPERVHSHHA